tara:strand:- start:1408 stop:1902 length:495 start_codon:yes stop_codon:yes gene_type:complete
MSSVFSFTVGWSIYAGRLAADVLYNNPLIYAVGLALVFISMDVSVPTWLANTTKLVGGLAIPLMLISLGVAIAKLNAHGASRIIIICIIKLMTGFLIGYFIARFWGLEGAAAGVIMIQSAMPVAVHNYMFAQRFNRSPSDTASLILISTAVSMSTLPLLMFVVL